MKRLILTLALCALPAFGAASKSAWATNSNSGGTLTVTATGVGTNLACVVMTVAGVGTTVGDPTCGGQAMTQIGTAVTFVQTALVLKRYIYSGAALTAGSISAVVTCSTYCEENVWIVQDAAQSGQPDASAPYVISSGGPNLPLPVSGGVVHSGSLVVGAFMCSGNCGGIPNPSSNGTSVGFDAFGYYANWYSTPAASAGTYSLNAYVVSGGSASYEAIGVSVAPYVAPVTNAPHHKSGMTP